MECRSNYAKIFLKTWKVSIAKYSKHEKINKLGFICVDPFRDLNKFNKTKIFSKHITKSMWKLLMGQDLTLNLKTDKTEADFIMS